MDPGLNTLENYLLQKNPKDKFHPSDSYDFDVLKLNQDYSKTPVGTAYYSSNTKYIVQRNSRAVFLEQDEKTVAVIYKGTVYTTKWYSGLIPDHYWTKQESIPLEYSRIKVVKYLDEALALADPIAKDNLQRYPVYLQRIQRKGQYFTLRAEGPIKNDKGTNLALLNSDGYVVAVAQNEWGATLLAVAKEYRGLGIGPYIGKVWYENNPSFQSGGYTNSGRNNAEKIWADRVREFLANGWYTELIRKKRITPKLIQTILADLPEYRGKSNLPKLAPAPEKPQLLVSYSDSTLVVYDARFFEEQDDRWIYGFGFLRDSSVGTFYYRLEYERKYKDLVTRLALQAARDDQEKIYVGDGYGDTIEYQGVPHLTVEGDYIRLEKDIVDLKALSRLEAQFRKKRDPYGEMRVLILEAAEGKNW